MAVSTLVAVFTKQHQISQGGCATSSQRDNMVRVTTSRSKILQARTIFTGKIGPTANLVRQFIPPGDTAAYLVGVTDNTGYCGGLS